MTHPPVKNIVLISVYPKWPSFFGTTLQLNISCKPQKSVHFLKGYELLPCEKLVSPAPNERETTANNCSFFWIDRRPVPWMNKLTMNW